LGPDINIDDYNYELPDDRIAQIPLPERDASKLLVFRNNTIRGDVFRNIRDYIPSDSMLVFNDSRVIRARIIFHKETGARIEVFCLEPIAPAGMESAFIATGNSTWKCLVGNAKRWKGGPLEMSTGSFKLKAEIITPLADGSFAIKFEWLPSGLAFSEVLEKAGQVPLPPYIHRENIPDDNTRYQTVYAHAEGSVAAPTAGLHFTNELLDKLRTKNIRFEYTTLHVGVGTFRPVASSNLRDHVMHHERIHVTIKAMKEIMQQIPDQVIAVGTTAARTLESLYWAGVKVMAGDAGSYPVVSQWDPYGSLSSDIPARKAIHALIYYLEQRGSQAYSAETQLMIVPGYRFRVVNGLVTNFHMPRSTLLLLVAAMIGERWKDAYQFAMDNNFRFLSYGDACLFFPSGESISENIS
jgi:S-adenosylmethionine:tRNA ribosyltransferase-isomerase